MRVFGVYWHGWPGWLSHLPAPHSHPNPTPTTPQQGFFSIIGSVIDNYKLCDLLWQPYQANLAPQTAAPLALTAGAAGWSEEKNEALTSFLADKLWASGALEAPAAPAEPTPTNGGGRRKGPVAPPLSQQVKDAIVRFDVAGGKAQAGAAPELPAVGQLAEQTAAALADALVAKIKPAAAATEGAAEAEGPARVALTGEEVAELVTAATFQNEEAASVAQALQARILANQAAFGKNYVFRVLELAEVGGAYVCVL